MPRRLEKAREALLGFAILTQLQWLFGNIYEEILTPNSITASVASLNCYNAFFRITEPYYYYVPLTQLGWLCLVAVAFSSGTPGGLRRLLRYAALFGSFAVALTIFIVVGYNMRMFFGPVARLGSAVHRLYLEWALLNALRIVLVGVECFLAIRAYRWLLIEGIDQAVSGTGSENLER